MLVKDERAWSNWRKVATNSRDPEWVLAVLTLAERWAAAMEKYLVSRTSTIPDMAVFTLRQTVRGTHVLDPHTNWGDFVADYLEECWLYGPEFHQWYCNDTD